MKASTICRSHIVKELRRKGIRRDEKLAIIYWGGLRSKVLLEILYSIESAYPDVELRVLTDTGYHEHELIKKYPRIKVTQVSLKLPYPTVEELASNLRELKLYCTSTGSSMVITPLTLDDLTAIGLVLVLRGAFNLLSSLINSPMVHPLSHVELVQIMTISSELGLKGELERLIEGDPMVDSVHTNLHKLKALYSYTPLQLLKALENLTKMYIDLIPNRA
ncbi:MAG: hypothetical protein DRN53_05080 [Thermoprotei archaeon]|nr:MAG: hypothetical protein DRN53_05080 [Thermoprotei archaeon]